MGRYYMNMQVMYQNNVIGEIDSLILNQMITSGRIKMFMRSDGWAMVGISPMRGEGGAYAGIDRRGRFGLGEELPYRIIT